MQHTPLIVNRRLKRRAKEQRNGSGAAGLGCSLFASLAVLIVVIVGTVIYTQISRNLPSPISLPLLVEPPGGALLQPTRLYDSSGQHMLLTLENPAAKDRRYLHVAVPGEKASTSSEADRFSTALVDATIAAADPTFWSDPGFIWQKWNSPEPATIAERLAADLLLEGEEPGILHNLRLRLLAMQITARYGRTKIMEWYLNTAQYGLYLYGADAAARVYFNKPASDLSNGEAAALAAIAEAPQISPFDAPQIIIEKQQQIVHNMVSLGFISSDAAFQAIQAPLNLAQPAKPEAGPAPEFTSLVLQQLAEQFGEARLARGGLRIRTSLDYDLQLQVNCAVSTQLERVNQPSNGVQATPAEDCPAARLLPTLPLAGQPLTSTLNAEVIVYDPHTGQILAQAGDPGQGAAHPSGSLITPFIYLTAFTRGLSPASLVWDIPAGLTATGSQAGLSGDAAALAQAFHGPVRIRTALANDYLSPATQLLGQVGPENVALTTQKLGVSGLDTSSIARILENPDRFEAGDVTLDEMARAYGVFANQGILAGRAQEAKIPAKGAAAIQPLAILTVETANGDLLVSCDEPSTGCTRQAIPVVSSQLAYLVTNVLSDETARWPAYGHPNALEIGRPAGAKIGRTADGSSAWTIGFTPQLLVGVWVGPEKSGPAVGQVAPNVSSALWHAIIQYASRSLTPESWTTPPGLQTVQVCDPSGMLPTATCPTIVNEIFLSGNEPTQPDNLYQVFHINRETGRLATVFTPPGLVEDRVYLVVPAQALDWARSTDLPIPPDNYDVIYTPQTSPNAVITTPQMFATTTGKITIQGTADGNDFSFFRLQYGEGLNPTEWVQVGKDSSTAVKDGTLGVWDTTGLNGLYALQLLVVHKDQRVESNILQLTLDSQPPQVTLLHPVEGQVLAARGNTVVDNTVVLQANASDNLALSRVEFYLDNQLVGTLYQAPYTLSWQVKVGSHKVIVKAYDLANNSSQASATFTEGK